MLLEDATCQFGCSIRFGYSSEYSYFIYKVVCGYSFLFVVVELIGNDVELIEEKLGNAFLRVDGDWLLREESDNQLFLLLLAAL